MFGGSARRKAFYLFLLFSLANLCHAQDTDRQRQDSDQPKPVPVISGTIGFDGFNTAGNPALVPFLQPVAVVPIGDKLLVEARADLLGFYTRKNGSSGPYGGPFTKALGYLQADYIADPHVTITAGRFLIPFNMYLEREDIYWIKTFQNDPFTLPVGTQSGAGDGVMLRGVIAANDSAAWNYATYYTVNANVEQFQSSQAFGVRTGVFFPHARFEIGGSYQRMFQQETNPFGFYASWQPKGTSVDIKWEYAHSPTGQAYWLQGATRLDKVHFWEKVMRRTELAARWQQTFSVNHVNSLTGADTNEPEVGLNFYFLENTRFVSSYGRGFSSARDYNVWSVGFTHRFTFPMWPGGKQ